MMQSLTPTMLAAALAVLVPDPTPSARHEPAFQAAATPVDLLVEAKTVAIVGRTGQRLMDRAWANPNGERGREKVAAVLSQWGRYRIVDDPLAADLILVVFETQKNLSLFKRANLVAELKVHPGGATLTDETPVLWSGEAGESFRKMPSTQVAEKFKDYVIELDKSRSGGAVHSQVAAAAIALANGQVIEGTVQGRVLVRRCSPEGNVRLRVVEGEDISRIDESGVHARGESIFLVGLKGATQEDVLQGLVWWTEGRDLKQGQILVRDIGSAQVAGMRVDNSSIESLSGELLGEYRISHRDKTIELLSAIRLKRPDSSTVTIPAGEIRF